MEKVNRRIFFLKSQFWPINGKGAVENLVVLSTCTSRDDICAHLDCQNRQITVLIWYLQR